MSAVSNDAGASKTGFPDLVVQRGVLRDGIANALKEAIVRGQIKPGQKLNEKQLADQLGVSRAPLREAFLKLEQEGLVSKAPHKGAIVTKFDYGDIIEIYDLRIPLEGFAARLVAEGKSRASEAERIRHEFHQMVQKSKETQLLDYLACDYRFHSTIWKASGNQRLLQMLTQLCGPFFAFASIQAVGFGMSFSTEKAALEHQRVVDAIERESPEVVENVVREVILQNKQEFVVRCYQQGG